VYRLIDPRNGETSYVGKGGGNRVSEHARGEMHGRARHLRHGMTKEQAFEVEAAFIDAYPEVTNQVGGRASDERGLMHANQVIERCEAKEAVFTHTAVIISADRSVAESERVCRGPLRVEDRNGNGTLRATAVGVYDASQVIDFMAPRVGIEPTTNGLTVRCSTAELPGNRRAKGADSPASPSA
jgi:hypothetical protein